MEPKHQIQTYAGSMKQKEGIFVPEGKVKWFNEKKGFGFISRTAGKTFLFITPPVTGEGFDPYRKARRSVLRSKRHPKARKPRTSRSFRFFGIKLDGFVRSPSVLLGAGLRFNLAPLDNNPPLEIQDIPPDLEAETSFEKFLTG